MKKLFTAIFILLCSVVFGQNGTPLYPITQNIGSTSALLDIKGGARVGGAFVLGHYADTTAANAVPYVKNFANGLITTDTNLLWIRSYNAQQWYFVPNTGNPATGDTLYWRVGGNALIPMQQQGIYTGLGSKDSTPLFFITNYQRRLVIPPNGVNRSAGTANKCLVIDTVTKFMYYTDCGSGGGTTYTFPYSVVAPGNAIQLENDTTDNPANYFYGRNSAGRRGWYPQSGIVGSTPTLQQVLTAGNDVTTNQTITTNSTVFRIKLDEDQDGVGFTGLNYNGLIGFQNGNGVMQFQNGSNLVGFDFSQGSARVQSSSSTKLSAITTYFDSVVIYPQNGNLKIDSLNYTLSTTGKKIMLRDTATGLVQNIDPLLLAQEAANFADTTNFKPVVINTTGTSGTIGKIYKATYWPGGGGGGSTSPSGNFGNLQLNRNGAFDTPGSDSLDFTTGLDIKGHVNVSATSTTGIQFGGTTRIYNDANRMRISPTNGDMQFFTSGSNISAQFFNSGGSNSIVVDGAGQIYRSSSGLQIQTSGNVGIGSGVATSATARLHISAGTATASTAPFKLTVSGAVLLTTPESGATEVLVDSIYYTGNNATRNRLAYATEIGSFSTKQGTDVASVAGAIVLGSGGNIFEITGTNAITLISNVRWQNGSEVTLIFTSTATLTDGTANSGTDIGMELAGNANFSASADDVLTLVLTEIGGTQRWREKSRSVN